MGATAAATTLMVRSATLRGGTIQNHNREGEQNESKQAAVASKHRAKPAQGREQTHLFPPALFTRDWNVAPTLSRVVAIPRMTPLLRASRAGSQHTTKRDRALTGAAQTRTRGRQARKSKRLQGSKQAVLTENVRRVEREAGRQRAAGRDVEPAPPVSD